MVPQHMAESKSSIIATTQAQPTDSFIKPPNILIDNPKAQSRATTRIIIIIIIYYYYRRFDYIFLKTFILLNLLIWSLRRA